MKARILLMTGLVAGLVSGCAAYKHIDLVRSLSPAGSSFSAHLADEYKALSLFEADQMKDYRDAEYFARKALAAANGQAVNPTMLDEREIPHFAVAELTSARAMLTKALGSKRYTAASLAEAQAKFDCWMEQQEENIQPDHIAECKIEFYEALKKMTGKKVAVVKEAFRVYFDHDSSVVTAGEMDTVAKVAAALAAQPGTVVLLTGNADTTGNAGYNAGLSKRRASAVKAKLVAAGVDASRVQMLAKGEHNLLVPTADGVREAKNRRVDVLLSVVHSK